MALVTTIDAATLAGRLGKPPADPEVARCLEAAKSYLEDFLLDAWRTPPPHVIDDCVVRVGRAVYESTRSGGGGGAQATQVGSEVGTKGPRDPLMPVYPILEGKYVLEGLA